MVNSFLEQFGITQRALAKYIGSEHSVVSRYIANGKYLQPHAVTEFYKIQMLALTLKLQPAMPQPTEKEKATMLKDAAFYKAKCTPIQKKLDLVKARYQQGVNLLQLLAELGPAPEGSPPAQQRWIDSQEYRANLKIKANGWRAQNKLQMAIDMLQYQAGLCEAVVNK